MESKVSILSPPVEYAGRDMSFSRATVSDAAAYAKRRSQLLFACFRGPQCDLFQRKCTKLEILYFRVKVNLPMCMP